VEPVLRSGESTALGTLGFDAEDDSGASFAATADGLVFHAALLGGRSREALLARRLR
jgi:hypothetical protein